MDKKLEQDLKVTFKQSIDLLNKKAVEVSKAITDLRKTGINEDVLYYVIQRAANKHYSGYPKIGIVEIRAVCEGMEGIEDFLFPKDK